MGGLNKEKQMKFFKDIGNDITYRPVDIAFDWYNESRLYFFVYYGLVFLAFPIWLPLRIFVISLRILLTQYTKVEYRMWISLQTFCNMVYYRCSGDTATNKQIGDSE